MINCKKMELEEIYMNILLKISLLLCLSVSSTAYASSTPDTDMEQTNRKRPGMEDSDIKEAPVAKRQNISGISHATDSDSHNTNRTSSSVDFNKWPMPGVDAFWAHNPHNPSQKILLVPSNHHMNLRFINPNLATAMENGDILITESRAKAQSWNDSKLFNKSLTYPLDALKQYGGIREEPFEFEGQPWTSALLEEECCFIQELFRKNYGEVSLSCIHPFFVTTTLNSISSQQDYYLGSMDDQIVRKFNLQNKPVYVLETTDDIMRLNGVEPSSNAEDIEFIKKLPIDIERIQSVQCATYFLREIPQKTPKAVYEKLRAEGEESRAHYLNDREYVRKVLCPLTIKRNLMWLPKLLGRFGESPDKYFVVVMGSGHFPSDESYFADGMLKLLGGYGFTFTPFSITPSNPTVARPRIKGRTPQTMDEMKVLFAVFSEKATKLAATRIVNESLSLALPNVNIDGIEQPSAVIKPELIKAMIHISKKQPNLGDLEYQALLYSYIISRNAIFTDPEIKVKDKAIEDLQTHPTITFEQLKQRQKVREIVDVVLLEDLPKLINDGMEQSKRSIVITNPEFTEDVLRLSTNPDCYRSKLSRILGGMQPTFIEEMESILEQSPHLDLDGLRSFLNDFIQTRISEINKEIVVTRLTQKISHVRNAKPILQ